MRYNTGHAEVQAEGFSQQVAGSIKASGKAFKGLIDGLYSRKGEAIVRELSTNGFDGQIANGYVGPFSVHLPSALDPVFWVRDYGVGMTHHFMMNRFPVLFDSTKDGTNPDDSHIDPDKLVGALGLGSKSFFAYTDACTITSWQDGVMNVYAVFMGGDGVIQVAHAGSMPSDEPSGVKVEFAVRTKDFKMFEDAAVRVYKGFPILPDGLPITVKQKIAIDPVMIGDGWKAYPKDYLPETFYARQGCVLYPIDLAEVDGRATEDEDGNVELSSTFQQFEKCDTTFVLDFPIGSVGFDLSRERLTYDDGTVQALRKRWAEFSDNLTHSVRQSFAGMATPYDRMRAAKTGALSTFGDLFARTPEAIEARNLLKVMWDEFPKAGDVGKLFSGVVVKPYFLDNLPTVHRSRKTFTTTDALTKAAFILIDEEKPHERRRIGRWLFQNDIEYAFTIQPGYSKKTWQALGEFPITRLSDIPPMPKPEKGERSYYGGGGQFHRIKLLTDDGCTKDVARDEQVDLSEHVFMFLNCGEIVHPVDGYKHNLDDIRLIHKISSRFLDQPIALINTRSNEPFEKWDEFPQAYHLLDTFAESLPDQFVKWVIDTVNRHRFVESRYCLALTQWREANPYSNDPITRMKRFERRYDAIPEQARKLCNALCARAGQYTATYTESAAIREMLIQFIERGRRMGLEILPYMPVGHAKYGWNAVKERLLPKRYEKVVDLISRPNTQKTALLQLLHKDITRPC